MGSSEGLASPSAQDLPKPDRRVLAHPPLEVAIFEVRLLGAAPNSEAETGLRLLEAVRAAGWNAERVEQAQQHSLQLQLGTERAEGSFAVQSTGWQLVDPSTATTATVFPDVVAIQAGKYDSWEVSFRPVVKAVLLAVAEVSAPALRQRLALRYVDRLVNPDAGDASAWVNRVAAPLLGAIAQPLAGLRVVSAQQQLELVLPSGRGAVLRHGPFPDGAERGAISYLVDIDVFDTASAAFGVEDVLRVADLISEEALAVFHSVLTPDYLTELRGTP